MYIAKFFETRDGKCPVLDFLHDKKTNKKLSASLLAKIQRFEEFGVEANVSKPLRDGLFEFRATVQGRNQGRIIFFYDRNNKNVIVLIHAFVKKDEQTPESDIRMALRNRIEYYYEEYN